MLITKYLNKIFNEYAVLVSCVVFCQYARVLYLISHKKRRNKSHNIINRNITSV